MFDSTYRFLDANGRLKFQDNSLPQRRMEANPVFNSSTVDRFDVTTCFRSLVPLSRSCARDGRRPAWSPPPPLTLAGRGPHRVRQLLRGPFVAIELVPNAPLRVENHRSQVMRNAGAAAHDHEIEARGDGGEGGR